MGAIGRAVRLRGWRAYPINGADPLLQEALGSFVESVPVGCLSHQDIEAPEVRLPIEDGIGIVDALVVDVQLVEIGGIAQVVGIACRLNITHHLSKWLPCILAHSKVSPVGTCIQLFRK
jgi:hypothetical protein